MTRATDVAIPPVALHPLDPGSPVAGWPWRPVFALERQTAAAYAWDDPDPAVVWDDPAAGYVWDAPQSALELLDVTCDWQAFDVEFGPPDEQGLYPAAVASLSLDNRSGRYAQYDASGRLTYWAPGRRLAVWARNLADGTDWWIADLHVESWTDVGDTVEIVAGDGAALLARDIGGDWTPGVAGQHTLARIQAIAAQVFYTGPIAGDPGDVALTATVTDAAPFDECQIAAFSDGGVFTGDADGTLRYRDRTWTAGRPDQTVTRLFTDNVCDDAAALVVWDAEVTTADDALATNVRLVNTAGLVAVASGPALNGRRYPFTHPEPDRWTTQAEGDTLAAALYAARSTPVVAIAGFGLHLLDPHQDLWRAAIDLRLGDRFRFTHAYPTEQGYPGVFDLLSIVSGVHHQLTPDGWLVEVAGTRTVDSLPVYRWDTTPYRWDETAPANVWR